MYLYVTYFYVHDALTVLMSLKGEKIKEEFPQVEWLSDNLIQDRDHLIQLPFTYHQRRY